MLAQGDRAGGGAGFADGGEELVEADADAGALATHQPFQRGEVLLGVVVVALLGGGAPQLAVLEVVGEPADAAHLDPAADAEAALAAEGDQHRVEPAEARGVDVGDVLPGRRQADLGRAQAAVGDLAQYAHERFSWFSILIGWAKAAERDWCALADGICCWLSCKATGSAAGLNAPCSAAGCGAERSRLRRMLRV
ncbi:hypothetical protein FQZ97_947210 [compost metagenome]